MNRQRLSTLAAVALIFAPMVGIAQSTIPSRLSDKEIWQLNADFSEPGGYFRSDNLLSNETGFQAVIPYLRGLVKPGGVYLGVGPEQNFTYIVALQPKMAIICDIRRGNMIEHLMYKALFETSADRADFLSKLFCRPRPSGLDTSSSPQRLFEAYVAATPDTMLYKRNLTAIKSHLASRGFAMGDSDTKSMEYIYSQFYEAGPQINYNFSNGGGGGGDSDAATCRRTRRCRLRPTQRGRTGPTSPLKRITGGSRISRRRICSCRSSATLPVRRRSAPLAQYLKEHHAVVGAFYTSNVEQYLFQQDDEWSRFYKNVATLPLDSTSTFIRSIGGGFRGGYNNASPQMRYGGRLASVTSGIQDLLKAFNEGKIQWYGDVISMSK